MNGNGKSRTSGSASDEVRQVALPEALKIRRKHKGRKFRGGIVAEADPNLRILAAKSVVTADQILPPIIPGPITASNGGGAIGTGLPVQLIFWGSAWNQATTNPSVGTIVNSVKSILSGPWMSGLRQYRIRRCLFGGAMVVTPDPPSTYNDGNVTDLIWGLIDGNNFPEPDDSGGRNLYFVFMPPGTTYGPGNARGKHLVASDYDFPADIDHAWVAFIIWNTLNQILSTFCHELAEMCTDPEGDAWTLTTATPIPNVPVPEIGDPCNAVDGTLNGINVESYWSVEDNACLIPTAYSLRRVLKWSGNTLGGQGLRSIQSPIASLKAFVLSL